MKPAKLGVTLILPPADVRRLSQLCMAHGVSRGAFVAAAVQDALDLMRLRFPAAPRPVCASSERQSALGIELSDLIVGRMPARRSR